MTPAAFKSKWHRFSGKESAAYQEHFNDLCHLLRQPPSFASLRVLRAFALKFRFPGPTRPPSAFIPPPSR